MNCCLSRYDGQYQLCIWNLSKTHSFVINLFSVNKNKKNPVTKIVDILYRTKNFKMTPKVQNLSIFLFCFVLFCFCTLFQLKEWDISGKDLKWTQAILNNYSRYPRDFVRARNRQLWGFRFFLNNRGDVVIKGHRQENWMNHLDDINFVMTSYKRHY